MRFLKKINILITLLIIVYVIYIIRFHNTLTKSYISIQYVKDPEVAQTVFKMNVEKLRSSLEPRCRCNEYERICFQLDEFDNYIISKKKNGTEKYSYKIKRTEFESSNIACDSFNVLRRGLNQKIISLSIEENEIIDTDKIKKLIKKVKRYFPEWTIRVYHTENVDDTIKCELECLQDDINQKYYDNIDFCDITDLILEPMNNEILMEQFRSWLPVGDHFADYVLIRDQNSCFGKTEATAVQEWQISDFFFYVTKGFYILAN